MTLEARLRALAVKFGLNTVYVFGSRAQEIARRFTGEPRQPEHSRSDVDIAAQPKRGHHLSAYERVVLMQALEDLLDVTRVDLVILPEANAFLAADAVRGEILFCADLDAQAEEELYYLRRAADLAPVQRRLWQERMEEEQA